MSVRVIGAHCHNINNTQALTVYKPDRTELHKIFILRTGSLNLFDKMKFKVIVTFTFTERHQTIAGMAYIFRHHRFLGLSDYKGTFRS